MPRLPLKGFLPHDEFEAKTVDEQKLLFNMFWNPERGHKYDPLDHWRLSPHPHDSLNPHGNVAVLGVFFSNPQTNAHLFQQKRILCPLSIAITRYQWRVILEPLILRDAMWCWLPGIIEAYQDDAWKLHNVVGWNCYEEKFYTPRSGDMILGPDICMPRSEYKAQEWIGTSLLQDIISPLSSLDA